MKKLIILNVVLAVLMSACGDNKTEPGTDTGKDNLIGKTDSANSNSTVNNNSNMNTENRFLADAHMANVQEIHMGEMMVKQTSNKDVKRYAQMMIDDHTKADKMLKDISTASLTDSMTTNHAEQMDQMKKMKKETLDKEYLNMMINDHNKVIEQFRSAADNPAFSNEVRKYANQHIPILEKHVNDAIKIKDAINK